MIHKRTKIIAAFALGLCFIALAIYIGFLSVVMSRKATLHAARLSAAEADMQSRALSQLEATVLSSKEDREKLNKYVLADDAIIDFLELIEETAKSQGVTLVTDSLTVVPIDDDFESLEIKITTKGSFDGIMRILHILEVLPVQSEIAGSSLTRSGAGGWESLIDLRVTKFKKI